MVTEPVPQMLRVRQTKKKSVLVHVNAVSYSF